MDVFLKDTSPLLAHEALAVRQEHDITAVPGENICLDSMHEGLSDVNHLYL